MGRCQETEESGSHSTLETCDLSWENYLHERSDNSSNSSTEDGATEGGEETSGCVYKPSLQLRKKVINHAELVKALRYHLCCPFSSTCETEPWLRDTFLSYYDKGDPEYRKACMALQRESQFWTFEQLLEIYDSDNVAPIWYARSSTHYMDRNESFAVLDDLLVFQLGTKVQDFMTQLFHIMERSAGKRNTMYVSGPAQSGKTYFFDVVAAFYLNVGHVANFVRGEHFPLNDCISRRVLYWNEPSIMPSAYDTVKMLTAGDPCPANVKYQGHSTITKTPLIITSNVSALFNDVVFQERVYSSIWKQCDFLRFCSRKPHPMAYADLVLKYV